MGGAIEAARAIVAVVVGAAVAYFWSTTRPADDITIVIGVGIVSIVVLFVLLKSIGKN